ncbi:hypothetical protein TRFO_22589 [Tritrichomonas foetus]|uniref:Uncharacterized protein n=1 Tax=Tritrichomonas foetus TaxID=1144522 RepID=A0A1J4KC77_9EUKA|nr:hypothetical protein TRFO_22589 [Tritrichomonas foetus]|eukprot:OHT08827.1 hypothetical protein TRFO_22589 [Tritrichomonas foetus]
MESLLLLVFFSFIQMSQQRNKYIKHKGTTHKVKQKKNDAISSDLWNPQNQLIPFMFPGDNVELMHSAIFGSYNAKYKHHKKLFRPSKYPLSSSQRQRIKKTIAKKIQEKKSRPKKKKYAPAMIPAVAIPADQLIIDGLPENMNHVVIENRGYPTRSPSPSPVPSRSIPPNYVELYGDDAYVYNPYYVYTPTPTPFPVAMVMGMAPLPEKEN